MYIKQYISAIIPLTSSISDQEAGNTHNFSNHKREKRKLWATTATHLLLVSIYSYFGKNVCRIREENGKDLPETRI